MYFFFQKATKQSSLVVQWLRLHGPNAGGTGSIPGWGTKIPYATQRGLKKKKEATKKLLGMMGIFIILIV